MAPSISKHTVSASKRSWESTQLSRASVKESQEPDDEEDFEFVFDQTQEVDFEDNSEDGASSQSELEDDIVPDENLELPVSSHREALMDLIVKNQVVVISGETGSGKTTQLPQFLHASGYKVACTQPRRLAAMAVASRVAKEMSSKLGDLVGYTIRFDDCSSERTEVKYLTDGMLLRELLYDPLLSNYDAIMVDEAHERTLHTDILLGLLRELCNSRRPDMRLIISSATMNTEKFSNYFRAAPIYTVPGRRHKISIHYTKYPEKNWMHAALLTVFQIHATQDVPGDVLVFLPGQDEIETLEDRIQEVREMLGGSVRDMITAPVYANLSPESQKRIFEPTPRNCRKIVLATNIAETSLTIDGIRYVIDPGFVKELSWSARSGIESLLMRETSRASGNQRAGRAGRTGPGHCFRLYTKYSWDHDLAAESVPEVLRTNLAGTVLLLLSLGVENVLEFGFIDAPPLEALVKSLELLYGLGAVDGQCKLTKLGYKMVEFPLDPQMSRTVIAGAEFGCLDQVVTSIALLGELGQLFYRPRARKEEADKAHNAMRTEVGDQLMLLNIWNQWRSSGESVQWCKSNFVQIKALRRARDVRSQLLSQCRRLGVQTTKRADTANGMEKAYIAGFFQHTARLNKTTGTYATPRASGVVIHPSSSLHGRNPEFVLYYELLLTSREFIRGCLAVERSWIKEVVPHFYYGSIEERKQSRVIRRT